ncbi:MAG: beta-eliminating lyase-related protein [Lachnospiraceae bacterium]|nr:beta-eliminating lyase-related protein [Lachnospiraceae bacterium]
MDKELEKLHFASDYMEGAHPQVLDALVRTNAISTVGYGEDEFCKKAEQEILKACQCPEGEVHFLIGGTQANAVVIDSLLRPYQGVISAESGHVSVHEAGAIEYGGHKVLVAKDHEGKLSADSIREIIENWENDANRDHMVMPGMVYISQPTEYGTLYTLEELTGISEVCREYRIPLYLDGARLSYALAAEGNDVQLPDLARLCDAFYIGGTKCGLLFGEAVVLPKKNMIPHFFSMIKQHGALLAKGRLLGVQFYELFREGLYERIGIPAILSAKKIKQKLLDCGYQLAFDSPTNQIFFIAEDSFIEKLGEKVEYGFMEKTDESHTMIRFATAWSTTDEETDRLLDLIDTLQ